MDLRIVKTRENLNKALVDQLHHKPLSKITVTELCRMAKINRSTYYLHYRDPYDQYEKLENSIYQDFADTIDAFIDKNRNWFTDLIVSDKVAQAKLVEELFSYIKKNALIYGISLPMNQGNDFLNKLYLAGHDRFFDTFSKTASQSELQQFEYFFAFVASGCVGVLRQWVTQGMKESPRDMARLTINLIHGESSFIDD